MDTLGRDVLLTCQRYIFWLNLPFCALAFIVIPIFLQMEPVRGSLKDKLVRVDWVGSVLFIASITAILVPITWVSKSLSSSALWFLTLVGRDNVPLESLENTGSFDRWNLRLGFIRAVVLHSSSRTYFTWQPIQSTYCSRILLWHNSTRHVLVVHSILHASLLRRRKRLCANQSRNCTLPVDIHHRTGRCRCGTHHC